MDVPFGEADDSCETMVLPSILILVPSCSFSCFVFKETCAMAAMEANASPLNPLVCKLNKSSAFLILEVAWRSKLKRASVGLMPFPSSIIWIRAFPASFIINLTELAPASMAFSSNSFTTDAGR